MRVMFVRARVLTLETGVPAMGYFAAPDSLVLAEVIRTRITHVIVGDAKIGHAATPVVEAMVRSRPERFVSVHRNPEFEVFRFTPAGPTP
jgi:hypothetical protein